MYHVLWMGIVAALLNQLACADAAAPDAEESDGGLTAFVSSTAPPASNDGGFEGAAAPVPEPASPPNGEPGPQALTVSSLPSRQLVRTAGLELSVEDTEAAAAKIQELASSMGGYTGHVNARRQDDDLYYQITLRVPQTRFGEALAGIKALAVRIESEGGSTDDVTEQYVDLEARLRTLKATEVELQALLAESRRRRNKVEDVMAVYSELTGIRSQIEQLQGQLNLLETQVGFSTINVTLQPDAATRQVVVETWRPSATARSAAQALVDVLQGLADLAIVATIVVVPVLLIIGVPLALGIRTLRRLRPTRARS
jgi:hypothetical protein